MRLKEIKPGMVIHCNNDEEKKALLEEAERLGYKWPDNDRATVGIKNSGMTIHFYEPSELHNFNHITWSDRIKGVTEFSDLILPELTAEEVWNGLGDVEDDEIFDYFQCRGYETRDNMILSADWKDLVAIVEKHIAVHEKKELEIGLKEAAKPLVDYLRKNYHPHVTAVVSLTDVEVLEGKEVAKYE